MCFLKEGKRPSVRKSESPLAENEIATGLREYKGSRRLEIMFKINPFYFALRCLISLILHHDEECSSESKIDVLKEIFHNGTILVSVESEVIFPTFHVQFIEEEGRIQKKKVKTNLFKDKLLMSFLFLIYFLLRLIW